MTASKNDMNKKEIQEKKRKLSHRVFIHMLEILAIFGVPAIGAYFAGSYIDQRYNIYPYGSMLSGAVALTISWGITIHIYKKIKKKYAELEQERQDLKDNSN